MADTEYIVIYATGFSN